MEQKVEELCRLVSSLSIDVNRGNTLKEILEIVTSVRKESLRRSELEQQIPRLFDCLNTSDDAEIKLVCTILTKILPDMNLEGTVVRCMQCIIRTLNHPLPEVRSIGMDVLLNAADKDHLLPVVSEHRLLLNVIMCLFTYDLHLTQQATEFIVKICRAPGVLKTIMTGQALHYFRTYRLMRTEFAFRIYEVIVGVSLVSEENFLDTVHAGLLGELLTEVREEDPLLQLNALDLIARLAEPQYAFSYLESEGIILYICSKFTLIPADPLYSLLLPGYVKFFGTVAHAHPIEMVYYHPQIIHYIVGAIVTDCVDPVSLAVLLETVAFIASIPDGKRALNTLGDAIPRLMSNFEEYIRYLPSEFKVRAMHSLADIIRLRPRDQAGDLLYITNCWFARISNTPLDAIVPYCYQPFPDLQLAGLKVTLALAEQPWGVQMIKNYIGLFEFLVNRQRACNRDCREAKYEIIKALLNSPVAENEFGDAVLEQMDEFVKQGPFFAESLMDVAVEETGN